MGVNFEWGIRAEYAALHLMHEQGIDKGLLDLYLSFGYDLQFTDKKKWNAIQKAYELDIKRCLKRRIGDRKGFKYRELK